jgi:phosphoglycolate phosphatase-like HAD superfamily hydrolase
MTETRGSAAPGFRFPTLLVLDFDGVICDSIDECFASSWIAYHRMFRKAGTADEPPAATRSDFARLRPFIKTGEDFVIIQEMLAAGASVNDQAGFDAAVQRAGAEKRALFKDLFYGARAELLEKDRKSWLALNRIYPHMAAAFARLPRGAPVRILSTKRPRFIVEILAAHRIEMADRHIIQSEEEPKLAAVERLRAEGPFETAIFMEDQIDHLRGNRNARIRGYLAAWGYVKEEWLRDPATAPFLTPTGFLGLVEQEYGRP